MKKIFTLVAMAAMAIGVNAQAAWVADVDYVAAPGGTLATEFSSYTTSGTNIIATISKSPVTLEYVASKTPKEITSTQGGASGLTPANWPDAGWNPANFEVKNNLGAVSFYTVNGSGVPYVTFVSKQFKNDDGWADRYYPGFKGEDATDGWTYYNPDGSAGLPTSGAYIKATSTEAGVMKIGAFVSKNNTRYFYIAKASDGKALQWTDDKNTTGYMIEGYVNGIQDSDNSYIFIESIPVENYLVGSSTDYTWTKKDETTGSKNIQGNNKWIWFVFDAEPNETYYIFGSNWQIGFQGVKFYKGKTIKDYTPSGIETVKTATAKKADAAIYNLAGQKVDAAFKGMVIMNGKKFINK